MAIPKNFQIGFELLLRAAREERLVLAECIDSASGEPRYVICVACTGDFAGLRIPLGHLHDGNAREVYRGSRNLALKPGSARAALAESVARALGER